MTSTFELAKAFFERMGREPKTQKLLKKYDEQQFQFQLKDDEPFHVDIKQGEVTVDRGTIEPDMWRVTHFETDRETLTEILQAKLGFTDAIYAERFYSDEFADKKPMIAWMGTLIRITQETR